MRRFAVVTVVVASLAAGVVASPGAGAAARSVTVAPPAVPAPPSSDTGFHVPFSGPKRYEGLAPTEATDPSQVNAQIGQARADAIAQAIGLDKAHTLTEAQYLAFISGGGVGGDKAAAALADRSVQIFINTEGNPLHSKVDGVETDTVLASYGLFVSKDGRLMSLANPTAPTRLANYLLAPQGYVNRWFVANGAQRALAQLYRSAYSIEALYGYASQQRSDPYQLVTNVKGGVRTEVGMSMAPALWLTNFALLYTLRPAIAAQMPAYWTPIPAPVARAIRLSPTGFVPYARYATYLPPVG